MVTLRGPLTNQQEQKFTLYHELFANLSGGQTFTTLDLSHAYLQLELEEESQELVTINTHKGLYKYTRLPFGVASAPAIFQRTMESLLQGLPMVCVYIDDIISGKTPEEHLHNLNEVSNTWNLQVFA